MKRYYRNLSEWQELMDEQVEAIKYSRWLSLLQEYQKHEMKVRDIYGFIG